MLILIFIFIGDKPMLDYHRLLTIKQYVFLSFISPFYLE